MNSREYLETMANVQQNLLEYIDDEDAANAEYAFEKFKDFISKIKIQENQYEFKSFLYLLIKIANNHNRNDGFINKIERILSHFKEDIKKNFTNSELFHIFKSNKRVLLFLFEEKIMNFEEKIAKRIIKDKYLENQYPQYFQPEIVQFVNEKWFPKYDETEKKNQWVLDIQQEIGEQFYELRKIGENDSLICKIIREDLLDDFIVYINEKNYKLNSPINNSIYETNNFLLKKKVEETTLIEYAAFFGSIRIFNYLKLNNISLKPSIWNYAIHSNNAELFQNLEENQIDLLGDEPYKEILKESIKCHHINIAYHIQSNYLGKEDLDYEVIYCLKYYNFILIPKDKAKIVSFRYFDIFLEYDYDIYVFILLNRTDVDIDQKAIFQLNI